MEGKVELSVERYEELRDIERGEHKKIEELTAELEKARDKNMVCSHGTILDNAWSTVHRYRWVSRDDVVSDIAKDNEHEKKMREQAEESLERLERRVSSASFRARLKYLFTGDLA
jgi:hypothetical protein